MPINNSGGPVALSAIRTELGLSSKIDFKLNSAEDGDITTGYVPINLCSPLRPSEVNPTSLSEWRGYDHNLACGSVKLGMVFCNYTPSTDICNLKFDIPASVDTSGTTDAQDTSVALSYVGCVLLDCYIGTNTQTLVTADYEYYIKLTFNTDPASQVYTVKPSTSNAERHWPTNKTSATDCYIIAAYGVSAGGYGFVRFGMNTYKIMQDFPSQTDFYIHIYGRRTRTDVASQNVPLTYSIKKQTLVNRPAVNGVDFGITIQEVNNFTVDMNQNTTAFRRVGYVRYNKTADSVTWTAL